MRENISYTISARGKKLKQTIDDYLKQFYPSISLDNIDSVFGFVEPTTLYSGRPYFRRQISDKDYEILQSKNIGLRLPFTNHYCTREEYEENKPLFEKYNKKGNSIICTNDDLAKWLKKDYPLYQLDASILKNLDTKEKISKALEIYDTVVLPMNLNNQLDFLAELEQKDRMILFGNAGCALSCPNRICYEYLSRKNKTLTKQPKFRRYFYFFYSIILNEKWCMNRIKPRNLRGITDFDLNLFTNLGYTKFKMLRERKKLKTGF